MHFESYTFVYFLLFNHIHFFLKWKSLLYAFIKGENIKHYYFPLKCKMKLFNHICKIDLAKIVKSCVVHGLKMAYISIKGILYLYLAANL